jgi:UDP-N-acetylglucosamine 1-carboxyvinyltransferase
MDRIVITGGRPLYGSLVISGAKNAALPLMAASLLTKDTVVLANVPHLSDILTMSHLLINHGVKFSVDGINTLGCPTGRVILLNADHIHNLEAPYDIVRKMRASVLVLGPLLARFGYARVSLPGGCAIGTRPVDLHLSALEQMGAEIKLESGYVEAKVKNRLKGAEIYFNIVSVGATENILMAATLAEGQTVLHNAACEPEITDLAKLLNAMGAKISGIGTSTLVIDGVEKLTGAYHKVVPDRIEAGTYAIAAVITGGELTLKNVDYGICSNILEKLVQIGARVTAGEQQITVACTGVKNAIDITTNAFPGFPTDMQAQIMSLLALSKGTSIIIENIFENRFMHVPELSRMGANISLASNSATIRGVDELKSAEVMATDLRASVSLVLAGLAAKGETLINRVYHLDRGYERIEQKLMHCGAEIRRIC